MIFPVTIRGHTYATAKEVCATFDLGPAFVYRLIAAGRQDEIGLIPKHPNAGRATPTPPLGPDRAVYPSRAAAAKAIGVTKSAISKAIRRGRLDTIGSRADP